MRVRCLLLIALVVEATSCARSVSMPSAPSPRAIATPVPRPMSSASVRPTATPFPQEQIRPPDVAGAFYPAEADKLRAMVDSFLANAPPPGDKVPVAILVPHAGYVYSGQVAAYSFRQLEGRELETAVIIANDHNAPLASPIAVWTTGGWETPLGVVPVDAAVAQALVEASPRIHADKAAFRREHPIEVELPFLQRTCPRCRIVPVLMSTTEAEDVDALAEALARVLAGRRAIIIASSDLSHYPPYDEAQRVDTATLEAIVSFAPETVRATIARQMAEGIPNLVTCACGEGAILATMKAARRLGAEGAELLHYANSGDVPQGQREQVVGYGAVLFWRHTPPTAEATLNAEQRTFLLQLARETIQARLNGAPLPAPEVSDPALQRDQGVFVTLKIDGELRGCIGHMAADTPLYEVVQQMALAAAFSDPRFAPLRADELPRVTIEISVLSPLAPLRSTDDIVIGRDGLLIRKGRQGGVFLPQVPVEEGWDLPQYLQNLCRKAMMPPRCWEDPQAQLYTFTAEVFAEE